MRGGVLSGDQHRVFMEWLVKKYCVDGMKVVYTPDCFMLLL